MTINWMQVFLGFGVIVIALSFWRAHKNPHFHFSAFDLIMVSGRVDPSSVAFMLVLLVSTWAIVNQELDKRLTEGMFGIWVAAWVTPLVTKVVFGKTEMPAGTSLVSTTTVTQETTAKADQ